MPKVVEQLFSKTRQSTGRQALLFLILIGARSGEVRGVTWQEFDFANRIWTIPAQRMKADVQHRVPLSTQATLVLQQRLEFANPLNLAFSNSGKAPISDMTLTKILRDHNISRDVAGRTATTHSFRSSFRDWASEHQYPRDFAERTRTAVGDQHSKQCFIDAADAGLDLLLTAPLERLGTWLSSLN